MVMFQVCIQDIRLIVLNINRSKGSKNQIGGETMKIEEVEINGYIYIRETNDKGEIVAEYLKSDDSLEPVVYLSEIEQAVFNTALTAEYMACLLEVQ